MSDFVSRIAARAVGEAPVARPRAASVFEDAGVQAEPAATTVPREVAAVPSAPPEAGRVPAPGASEPPIAAQEATSPTREPVQAESRATPAHPTPEPNGSLPRPAVEVRAVEATPAPTTTAAPDGEAIGHPAGRPVASEVGATPTPVAVAVAKPAPLFLPLPAVPPAPAAEPVVAAVESPAVRVHIGRLEVRANLERPVPPRRRARADEQSQELSLADYLRGKRAAG